MADIKRLEGVALRNRRRIVDMVHAANAGHVGGSLSVIDVLTAIYEEEIDLGESPRSRLVLSKGHATPALYAELTEKGVIDEAEYPTFRQIDSRLQGHPYELDVPEVDASTGLLGQGFSIALGMALAKRAQGDDHYVYAICGDGEIQEGQIWEALMCSAHNGLDRLVFVIDRNGLSSHCPADDNVCLEPLDDKLRSFGLHVIDIDGHDMGQIVAALEEAKSVEGRPTAIVSRTVKGKGVSFMENNPQWHSSGLSDDQYAAALRDLGAEGEGVA